MSTFTVQADEIIAAGGLVRYVEFVDPIPSSFERAANVAGEMALEIFERPGNEVNVQIQIVNDLDDYLAVIAAPQDLDLKPFMPTVV